MTVVANSFPRTEKGKTKISPFFPPLFCAILEAQNNGWLQRDNVSVAINDGILS